MPTLEVESPDAPREPSAEQQKRVEQLFHALGRDWSNTRELAEYLGWPKQKVFDTMAHLREYSAYYGWTVPHVPRGRLSGIYPSRFLRVKVDSSADPYHTDAERKHLEAGLIGTLRHKHTMGEREADAIEMAAPYQTRPALRRALREYAYELRYMAHKAEQLLGQVNGA